MRVTEQTRQMHVLIVPNARWRVHAIVHHVVRTNCKCVVICCRETFCGTNAMVFLWHLGALDLALFFTGGLSIAHVETR